MTPYFTNVLIPAEMLERELGTFVMASQMLGIAQGSDTKAVALISERNLAISSVTRAAFVLIEMFIWLALRSLREFLRELKTNNGSPPVKLRL